MNEIDSEVVDLPDDQSLRSPDFWHNVIIPIWALITDDSLSVSDDEQTSYDDP